MVAEDAHEFTVDLNEVTFALSETLDLVGVDDTGHGQRVAYVSEAIGRVLEFDGDTMEFLLDAAVLHDCGVSSTEVHQQLIGQLDFELAGDHCKKGHALLGRFAPYAQLAPVVLHHHTHWSQIESANLSPANALLANGIFLADRLDACVKRHGGHASADARSYGLSKMEKLSGNFFAPQLVDALQRAAGENGFWEGLMPGELGRLQERRTEKSRQQRLNYDEMLGLATIFANVVDVKSPFTHRHSQGVARLCRLLGQKTDQTERTCDMLELCGLLHDLGKLRVPDEILDKPGPLNAEETRIIQRHSHDTFKILSRVDGLKQIAEWAGLHHETLNGGGYPFHRKGSELSTAARIVAVADIFQALSQNRPYRPAMTSEQVMGILKKMAAKGQIDDKLVELVDANLDACIEAARTD